MSLLLLLAGAGPAAVNVAPVVSAGPDANSTTGAAFGLSGSVTDDGLPSGTLTSLWTQTSGPDTAVFDDDTSPTSLVTCPTAGVYVFRLTGDDGALTDFDEITITVSDTTTIREDWQRPWIRMNWI